MTGVLFINGNDAYTTYGVTLGSTALSTLMTPPPMKSYVENSSRLEHGKRVSYNNVYTDERTITLLLNLSAPDEDTFYARYKAFCDVLTGGEVDITTKYEEGVVYRVYYVSCTQFTEYCMGVAQFSLKVCEPNCNDRAE